MDKLYRHVKTGEVKPLPDFVYKVNKKHWIPLPDSQQPQPVQSTRQDIISDKNLQSLKDHVTSEINRVQGELSAPSGETTESPSEEPTKEQLQAEYEAITGEKPDGRWSVKKLQEKIQETKG